MIIYFKIPIKFRTKAQQILMLSDIIVSLSKEPVGFSLDTDDKSHFMSWNESIPVDNEDYVLSINNEKDVDRLIRIVKGEEIARFNSGKPEFTYIDFRLFENMDEGVDLINQLVDEPEDYYHEILFTLSAISFNDDIPFHLKRLQALCYKLSLTLVLGKDAHIKKDPENPLYDLRAFESMAQVMMFGGKKYERNNWMKPNPDPLSSGDSLDRHVKWMIIGEMDDTDSGLPHIGHIMCNVMFLTYHLTKQDE